GGDGPPGRADAGGGVGVDGLVMAGTARAARLLIPFLTAAGGLGVAGAALSEVALQPVGGFDPRLGLVAVSGRIKHPLRDATDGDRHNTDEPRWDSAAQAARRALAHELCGVAQSMLDQAVAYVSQRHQFGR